ncbi:uncharacterized protein LOC110440718 [Mizuhopecten yessoensis]|uniref:uncharacterized protein LOC110440718 n=1 Tax=Mizuhopecten yessoensis TaxID=6573 RepID=UPI000B45E750|nr:uncharacterized protein LOC110440718 [Mizuhopecten yessoensis]
MAVDFLLNNVDKSVTMDLVSPWKKAGAFGSLTNDRTLKQLEGRLTIDTNQEYLVNAEVRQSRKGSAYVYTPTFTVTAPGKNNINLGGSVEYLPSKSIDGDLTLAGITAQPVKGRCEYLFRHCLLEHN